MATTKLGYVYFIQAVTEERLIKIGWTESHPDWRLQQLRCMSPVPLMPLGVIRTHFRQVEANVHVRLGEHRRHGEWFAPTEPVLAFIKKKARRWPVVGDAGVVAAPTPDRMRRAWEREVNDMIEWALSVERIRRGIVERERRKQRRQLLDATPP
jgi:hypothetical protein